MQELYTDGLAIGYPGSCSGDVVTTEVPPGGTLLLYTDGLVEGGKDIGEGLAILGNLLQRHGSLPPAELARTLVEETLEDALHTDDSLALILRREVSKHVFTRTLHGGLKSVGETRREVGVWLTGHKVEAEVRSDLLLVTSELLANAVAAAEDEEACLELCLSPERWVVAVSDNGNKAEEFILPTSATPEQERGRGLIIAQLLSDGVEVHQEAGKTWVRAHRRRPLAIT